MSKRVTLSNEAYEALVAQKQGREESLSEVILRFVPRLIRTFGNLEKHLQNLEGPIVWSVFAGANEIASVRTDTAIE
jgi:predicted CopG family antitoxin